MPAVARGERPGRGAPSAERGRASRKPATRGSARPLAKPPAAPQRGGLSPLAALNAAGAIIAIGLFVVLFTGDRAAAAVQAAVGVVDQRLANAGVLRVEAVHLQGASPRAKADILNAAAVLPGDPILGVDLEAARARIEATGWAKSVTVMRLLPASVAITVVEHTHAAVWQHAGRTVVVDADGQALTADPGAFPDLPLIVGAGAPEAAAEILPLVAARPRLVERLEALVRVDRRRWDLRLNDGALIQLPAAGVDSALLKLDTLDARSRVLELGFAKIDLREPDMVAVRPKPAGDPADDKLALAKFAAGRSAAGVVQN